MSASAPPEITIVEEPGFRFAQGPPGRDLMRTVDDANLLLEACFSSGTTAAILDAQNLTGRFFDLSSGEAGAILQKLRNYRIRLAVVCTPGSVCFSTRFPEMAAEEARGGLFGVFPSHSAAREWLRSHCLDVPA
jgi:hypothetical protein